MQKLLFILLILFSHVVADDWISIVPLPHCSDFKIQYKISNGKYHVRYQKKRFSDFTLFPRVFDNINDLSLLTDDLVETSYNFCSMTIELTEIDGEYTCSPRELSAKPFSSDYTGLLQEMIKIVDMAGNNCKDVIPLIKLQNEIGQLDQKTILRFNKSINLLKVFTGSSTDNLIDHFYECGGKKGSEKFIENLILLEAKNSCMFPSPPGLLSFEKAQEIAKVVSAKYKKNGLINLNSKKDNIVKDTISAFVNASLNQQIKGILGPEFNSQKFVNSLDITKKLKKTKPEDIQDYSTYVLAVDAPLEIIDKALPQIINKNFAGMLPNNMSYTQKSAYINKEVSPIIKKDYTNCIKDFKKRVDYPSKRNRKDLMSYRKDLKAQFCKKNPIECKKTGCNTNKNFGTLRSDIKDMGMIQACLFKGITNAIKPILSKIIKSQQEEFKDSFSMSDTTVKLMSEEAFKKIHQCTDKKIKSRANKEYPESFTDNIEALYFVNSKEYTQSILECSKGTERVLTGLFSKMLITNMPVVKEAFKGKNKVHIYDQTYNQKAYSFATKATEKALDKCLSAQKKRVTEVKTSAISCKPIIEMEVGKGIIKESLSQTMKKSKVLPKTNRIIVNSFNTCADFAILTATESMFNKSAYTPILDPKSADNYLNKNHEFNDCVKSSIVRVSKVVTEKTLQDMEVNLSSRLKDPLSFKYLTPKLKQKVTRCFEKKFETINSWGHFQAFNRDNGIEKLKDTCTEVATNYALPKIMLNETSITLNGLRDSGITEITTSDLSLALKKEYNLNVDLPSKNGDEKVILEAFKIYQKQNPKAAIEDFITKYSETAKKATVGEIGTGILDGLISESLPGFDFSDLRRTLPKSCLFNIFNDQQKNLDILIKKINEKSKGAPKPQKNLKVFFINLLQKGLIWSKQQGRYEGFIKKLSDMCTSPKKYRDLKMFAKAGIADDVILGVIEDKVHTALKENASNQCYDEIQRQDIKLETKLLERLCSTNLMSPSEHITFKKELLEGAISRDEKSILDFTLNRKRDFLKQIRSELGRNDLEEMFYKDREVLNYIYDNFDKVVLKEPKTMENLVLKSVDKIFKDKSKTSFASKFAENQIVSAIGITGLSKGKDTIKSEIQKLGFIKSMFKEKIKPEANNEFYKRWNHNGVSHYLNWEGTPQEKREELIEQLVTSNIMPRIDSKISDSQEAKRKDAMVLKIQNHVGTYPLFKNPKYKENLIGRARAVQNMHKVKKKLSFTEMLAHDLKTGVTQNVKESIWDSLNPF